MKTSYFFYILFIFSFDRVKAQCFDPILLYNEIGKILTKNDNKQIIKELQDLKSQYQKCYSKNDSIYAKIVHTLGRTYWYSGDLENGIKYTKESIIINRLKSLSTKEANLSHSYYNLGKIYRLKNDYINAIFAFKSCTKIALKYFEKYSSGADAHIQLSSIYYEFGDYEKSINESQKGYILAKKTKKYDLMIQSLNEKGQALLELQKVNEAENAFNNSFIISQNSKNTLSQSFIYSKLASINKIRKNFKAVIYYYQKAFEINKKTGFNYGCAENLTNLGYFYRTEIKDYSKSLDLYKQAIEFTDDKDIKIRIFNNIGFIFFLQKQHRIALINYQKGLNIAPINFFTSKIEINPPAKSIQLIFQKEYLLTLIQDKADTWLDYYKATNTKSHLTNALKTYALADSMIDFMRYEHVGEGSKLFWRQKTRGMYERAIEASYLAGDTEAAFRFFEKSKAVLLSDKLNELGANQQLTENSAKRQRSLRDSIANLQNQLASLPANDAKRSGIQRRLEQFNDDFEAFRKQLESTNPAYYRYKYDNSTPTIAEFQKTISASGSGGHTAGFVSYFVGDSAIYAFCLDQKARLVRLSLRPSDYQSLANEFLSLCADRSRLNAYYPQYRALAHRLYQLLWKPLGMTASRVIISQDGVFLPFETLLVQPNQNDFLLKHHAISYTYSANFLAKNQTDLAPSLRQGDKLFHRSFVGFAPETFQPSLRQASLKGSVAALEAVEEKFWWGKTLKNNEATKAQFMRYAPHSRVIQLFTHADADSTEAVEPRIYFHDAALRLSELTQADRFAAQLLVLSACKTGVGQNQRGEGVFSLARGFAALGIPSTITTLWSVEDQPTYELTKLFYHYLDQGLPKDEALQRAKLDWLNQGDAADALPSQWAGMILVGDTAPLAMDGLQFIVLGLGLLGLGVLGGVWWWRRKK